MRLIQYNLDNVSITLEAFRLAPRALSYTLAYYLIDKDAQSMSELSPEQVASLELPVSVSSKKAARQALQDFAAKQRATPIAMPKVESLSQAEQFYQDLLAIAEQSRRNRTNKI